MKISDILILIKKITFATNYTVRKQLMPRGNIETSKTSEKYKRKGKSSLRKGMWNVELSMNCEKYKRKGKSSLRKARNYTETRAIYLDAYFLLLQEC